MSEDGRTGRQPWMKMRAEVSKEVEVLQKGSMFTCQKDQASGSEELFSKV